jgi:regulator of protease activity HflC (stomatin/prohibitin superfamily)
MVLIGYFKAEPTEYILASVNGRVFCQGAGRTFWYWPHRTSIVLVPVATTDVTFAFNEATGNFQAVTLQGQFTYRITQPQVISQLLNFTINPRTRQYRSEDPDRLNQRIVNIVQMYTRNELQQLSLEDALRSSERLARRVMEQIREEQSLVDLGVECLSLFFTSIKATPEMTRALEADYRESLQQRADQAIYSRRAEAVEQERKIKQNELSTEVDLEKRRQDLVDLQGTNARKQAEFEAEAMRISLTPYIELDSRLLMALAFRNFADNASKIGNLTITSEILEQLLNTK